MCWMRGRSGRCRSPQFILRIAKRDVRISVDRTQCGATGDPDAVLRFAPAASGWGYLKVWSGPVSRILFPVRDEDHSSATRVAAVVKQPTRKLITETGGSMTSLFGLAPQGVCRAAHTRVGRGALLPHRFTLASFPSLATRNDRRSILCCTFRRVAAPGR